MNNSEEIYENDPIYWLGYIDGKYESKISNAISFVVGVIIGICSVVTYINI